MINVKQYAVNCFRDEAQAILDLIPLIDENFDKAVELIYNCQGKVIVTGVGKSGHVGAKIAATLASLGTPSFFLNPLDAFHGDLGMIASGDVVIAISYSGGTDELLRFIPLLVQRSIPIVGITSNKESLLCKYSECVLNIKVDHEADPLNLAPTSSTATTMAMGDALACALVKLRNFKSSDFARFHPGGNLGKRLLTRVKDVMYKSNLPILTEQMSIMDAIVVISSGNLGLAVVLEDKSIRGLVTSGDLRRAFQKYGESSFKLQVHDVMKANPCLISQEAYVSEAEEYCKSKKVNSLVVVNERNEFSGFIDLQQCML